MKNFIYGEENEENIKSDLEYLFEDRREYYYELLEYKNLVEEIADKLNACDCLLALRPYIDRDITFFPDLFYNDDLASKIEHIMKFNPPFKPDFEHDADDFEVIDGDGVVRKFKYIIELEEIKDGAMTFEAFMKRLVGYVDIENRCIECGERSRKYGEHCTSCASKLDGAGVGAEYAYLTKRVLQAAQILDPTIDDEDTAIETIFKHLKGQKDA